MASSLEELVEEWEEQAENESGDYASALYACSEALRDTMIVMQAEEVRRGAVLPE